MGCIIIKYIRRIISSQFMIKICVWGAWWPSGLGIRRVPYGPVIRSSRLTRVQVRGPASFAACLSPHLLPISPWLLCLSNKGIKAQKISLKKKKHDVHIYNMRIFMRPQQTRNCSPKLEVHIAYWEHTVQWVLHNQAGHASPTCIVPEQTGLSLERSNNE